MKNRRTYDFNPRPRTWPPGSKVREFLIDGWKAYYQWRDRLRESLPASQSKSAAQRAQPADPATR